MLLPRRISCHPKVSAPLGFEFHTIKDKKCEGFVFYPTEQPSNFYFEGEHVVCRVLGQTIQIVFIGDRGLESETEYTLAANLFSADRLKANLIREANWILQTYQYEDHDLNDGLIGDLIAMDEVLIPTYSLNRFVYRFDVLNALYQEKGMATVPDLRFKLQFSGGLKNGQIVYMEAPMGFQLHHLKDQLAAPLNQVR